MARAKSHGAAANNRRPDASSSSGSRSNSNNDSHEEGIGLLAAGPDADDDDDGSIADPDPHHTARTPRTPNRVRFDLTPTFVDSTSPVDHHHHDDNHHYARESFDAILDTDPLSSTSHPNHTRHQRVPLLTDIEAPSVTLSSAPDSSLSFAEEERSRPKSSLPSAFMNMANSIIGAGIIGQPYAFRQAGLLSGILLLVGLTFVVDWTICLIVVNSKLSGAGSFQGTVEKCFGRGGLIAVSVAQWAFAFGGMVAFGVIVGDSIPMVLVAVWPGLRAVPVLGLLADRRVVIVVFTMGISYPLALYRDIAKVSCSGPGSGVRMGSGADFCSWPRRARSRW